MPNILIIGASRGLGLSLAKQYAAEGANTVYGTSRSSPGKESPENVITLANIDLSKESVGQDLVTAYKEASKTGDSVTDASKIDVVVVSAGYFGLESFDKPDFQAQLTMYKTSAIGPVFAVQALVKAGLIRSGSAKIVLVSSEGGSIGLRHESEGGGNYGHHASKAALNMVGKLLSYDLKGSKIAVVMVHPGFMRTEMTRSVGFDKFWDEAGAMTPDEAASLMIGFVKDVDMSKTGQFWAPRGAKDIGTAEQTLGPIDKLPTPLELPW